MKSSPKQPAAPQNPALSPSHLDFPVVGIGASAGGLEAICTLFRHMPSDCGMAFVVVLHLSPDHQSVADRIIQATTQMPVRQVTEPVPIERNHVYVISPANRLSTNDGYLRVSPPIAAVATTWPLTCSSATWPTCTRTMHSAWCCRAPAPTVPWGCRGSRSKAA